MDHLDLAGLITPSSATSSTTCSWLMPTFDQQDANFLSTSRQMLEPIIEETSEDEDNHNWSQVWSESDTGSVIRIELHNDPDSVSERDFACPAKRARRDDHLLIVEETQPSQSRKYQRNETLLFNNIETSNLTENYRKRFDELYSDSDSLSFNSLSRSSSLIQFESLERQLQNDLTSIGNSSPSLLSGFNGDNKGSDTSLRRFESSDGRLHQTYFDLDKINFDNTLMFNDDQNIVKSDSESSDNSILSHEERILKPKKLTNNNNNSNINNNNGSNDQRSCYKGGKSSAENLSEDSGYCEHITALRIKSKSIPNFLRSNQSRKLNEITDEFENHKSLEILYSRTSHDDEDHEFRYNSRRKCENSFGLYGSNNKVENFSSHIQENCLKREKLMLKPKIDGKRCSSSSSLDEQIEHHRRWYNSDCEMARNDNIGMNTNIFNNNIIHSDVNQNVAGIDQDDDVKNKIHLKHKNKNQRNNTFGSVGSSRSPSPPPTASSSKYISSSLPDVRIQYDHGNNISDYNYCYKNNNINNISGRFTLSDLYKYDKEEFSTVSSVPNNLNLIGDENYNTFNENVDSVQYKNNNVDGNDNDDNYIWNLGLTSKTSRSKAATSKFARSENRLSAAYSTSGKSLLLIKPTQNYIAASYNNLTLLDYSGKSTNRNSFTMSDYSGNSKRNSREFDLGKGNFLLDEISTHFDRNLSILSDDRNLDNDMINDFLDRERRNSCENQMNKIVQPPKVPARRSNSNKEHRVSAIIETTIPLAKIQKPPRKSHATSAMKSFDQDPTNLRTSYAESLEKCNFDPKELSNTDLELISSDYSVIMRRGLVASTPNLNAFKNQNDDIVPDDLYVSSAHNSMNPIPGDKKLGILLPVGNSRNSLGKGVSFCPVVSEISWREQSSEECMDPDSLESISKQQQQLQQHKTTEIEISANEIQRSIEKINSIAKNNDSNETKSNYCNEVIIKYTPNSCELEQQNEEKHQQQQKQEFQQHDQPQQHDQSKQHESMNESHNNAIVSNVSIVEENSAITDGCGERNDIRLLTSSAVTNNKNNNTSPSLDRIKSDGVDQQHTDNNNKKAMDNTPMIHNGDRDNKNVLKSNNTNIKNNNNNNNNLIKVKMSNVSGVKSATMPAPQTTTTGIGTQNTGTDLLSSKFKPKPDEKHHKNGFLSRFTGGFRFSLRRKKKPSTNCGVVGNDDKNSNELNLNKNKKSVAAGAVKSSTPSATVTATATSTTKNKTLTPDFIYIPLKGPLPNELKSGKNDQNATNVKQTKSVTSCDTVDNARHPPLSGGGLNEKANGIKHVLLGKPPLPKQPPRVVGVCEKVRACQQRQQSPPTDLCGNNDGNGRHALVKRSSSTTSTTSITTTTFLSQPREIDERFLDSERSFYNENQLNGTMNESGCNGTTTSNFINLDNSNDEKNSKNVRDDARPPISGGPTSSSKIGLIETNLDTHETIISGKTRSLMELGPHGVRLNNPNVITDHHHHHHHKDKAIIDGTSRRPHKSMEFLLDKENQKNALPPENELQKSHDSTAALSEHQLRVQASLQRLNIPEWFRQYSSTPKSTDTGGYKPGSFTRKRASDSGRWAGLNSKTTSLSSLGSQRSDRSPLMLSPSAHSHHGGQTGFSRWSTSHLNSTQTSPSVSTRGSFCRGAAINSSFISGHSVGSTGSNTIRNSFRQPYLGWRSQEKLAQPRTPHERLASSLLSQQPQKQEPAVTPEIQSSIKEVTSAIVHYVNDQTNRTSRSRSTSPTSRKCWLESSFVGVRPLDSPQTPIIENSFNTNVGTTQIVDGGQLSNTHHIGSTSDVLRMNGVGDTANEFMIMQRLPTSSASPSNLQVVDQQNRFRRRSEGDAQKQQQNQQQQQQQQQQHLLLNQNQQQSTINPNTTSETSLQSQPSRRVSLDSSESKTTSELFVKCRNTKCDQSAAPIEAKKFYKSCHNCSHLYCSRECRRAHWEKHRKACLHSRVSNLCRQVLSSCKDDVDTLRHLSLLARKGYLSQGRGVVRILFRSPENAEAFIKNGFQCLGEASYVRWPDLMPAEMGLELYSELLRLSTEYRPDSKMLIYVAICVVSEAPGTATAPVRWERQLVSRCAKLKLSKSVLNELEQTQHSVVVVKESATSILILTFDPQKRTAKAQRELIMTNIQTILNQRGVILRKHYPEILQRLQTFVEGQTDRFMPVTIHPRDSQTGQGFVCIIMPHHGESELIRLPTGDSGNYVNTIDVGELIVES